MCAWLGLFSGALRVCLPPRGGAAIHLHGFPIKALLASSCRDGVE